MLACVTRSKLVEVHPHMLVLVDCHPMGECPSLPLLPSVMVPAICLVGSWPTLRAKAILASCHPHKTSSSNNPARLRTQCHNLSRVYSKDLTKETIHNLLW